MIHEIYQNGELVHTETLADAPVELWPYQFQELLTDEQLVAIQTSEIPALIRMRSKLQTIVSPMPFGPGSELQMAVYALGMLMPSMFTETEVARILNRQPPE